MRRSLTLPAALTLTLALLGCPPPQPQAASPARPQGQPEAPLASPVEGAASAAPAQPQAAPAQPEAAPGGEAPSGARVYEVVCGCTIPAVGHCGEYAKHEGRFLQIQGELGLGEMPFCGKSGLKARIEGEVAGDALRATSFELLP